MHFGEVDRPVSQPNARNSLSFEPTAAPVSSSQPGPLPDSRPDSHCLDLQNGAEDLEIHDASVYRLEAGTSIRVSRSAVPSSASVRQVPSPRIAQCPAPGSAIWANQRLIACAASP